MELLVCGRCHRHRRGHRHRYSHRQSVIIALAPIPAALLFAFRCAYVTKIPLLTSAITAEEAL